MTLARQILFTRHRPVYLICHRLALLLASILIICLFLTACAGSPVPNADPLTIAAAANLSEIMDEIARTFEKETNVHVVVSYGSTAQLAQQIEHGGPFDVFAS